MQISNNSSKKHTIIKSILYFISVFFYIFFFKLIFGSEIESSSQITFYAIFQNIIFIIIFFIISNLFNLKNLLKDNYIINKFNVSDKKSKIHCLIITFSFSLYSLAAFKIYEKSIVFSLCWIILSSVVLFCLIVYMTNQKFELKSRKANFNNFSLFFTAGLILTFLIFINNSPVKLTTDSGNQFSQVMNKIYVNWHPVAHTFVFFEVPMQIFGRDIPSVAIAQYFIIGIAFSYFAYSFYLFGFSIKSILIMVGIMLIVSIDDNIFTHVTKDAPFAAGVLMTTVSMMWIYFTDGKWLKNIWNLAIFAFSLFLVLYMRHNGIIAVVPTIIFIIIAYKPNRKAMTIFGTLFLIAYFVITGPIYSLLGIHIHSNTFTEALGVPNNQICSIVQQDGKISDEDMDFIEQAFPVDSIRENYNEGSFNSVKYFVSDNPQDQYIDDYIENHKLEYLKVWFNLVINNFGIAVKNYYNVIFVLLDMNMAHPFEFSVGFALFIILLTMIIAVIKDKKRFLPFVPVMFNFLSGLLLITGGETRYVFANIIVFMPLLIFSMLYISNKKTSDELIAS